jgi:hypothetical protein
VCGDRDGARHPDNRVARDVACRNRSRAEQHAITNPRRSYHDGVCAKGYIIAQDHSLTFLPTADADAITAGQRKPRACDGTLVNHHTERRMGDPHTGTDVSLGTNVNRARPNERDQGNRAMPNNPPPTARPEIESSLKAIRRDRPELGLEPARHPTPRHPAHHLADISAQKNELLTRPTHGRIS